MVIAPLDTESEHMNVILGGFLNIADGVLRDSLGEMLTI